jgi:hypothetical protein
MFNSLTTKLVGIGSVVALAGALAASPANAITRYPTTYVLPCYETGPRIATTTAGTGFGYTAIHGSCFKAGDLVEVTFERGNPPDTFPSIFWERDVYLTTVDGTFTVPMLYAPSTTISNTEVVMAFDETTGAVSNMLDFQFGGTNNPH